MTDGLRILLLDDNPEDRLLIRRELERAFDGVQVETPITVEDLDQTLAGDPFDVVITDYQLRWSDGLTVLRRIKAQNPACPVIMFTATGTQEIAVAAMKAGLDDYIIKAPRHYIRLAGAVHSAVERAGVWRRLGQVEQRLQSLLDRLNVGVYQAAPDGRLREANSAFLRLLGLGQLPAAPGVTLSDLGLWPDDAAAHLATLRRQGEAVPREVLVERAHGRCWLTVSETLGGGAEPVVDGLVEDISDRKRAEEEREAALQVREGFLTTAAHELRTPLTTLKATAQLLARLLERQPVDETRLRRYSAQLLRHFGRLETLVDDLLDVSRLRHGRLELHPERGDLAALAREVLARFEQAPERTPRHRLILEAPEPVWGWYDPSRMDQVLTNLISNALKYSPEGGEVRVRVSCGDRLCQITVSDQGIGIPAAEHAALFQPFGRSETVRRSIQGEGLGLYISQQIMARHGGRIELTSEPGVGSTFTVHLPLDGQ